MPYDDDEFLTLNSLRPTNSLCHGPDIEAKSFPMLSCITIVAAARSEVVAILSKIDSDEDAPNRWLLCQTCSSRPSTPYSLNSAALAGKVVANPMIHLSVVSRIDSISELENICEKAQF